VLRVLKHVGSIKYTLVKTILSVNRSIFICFTMAEYGGCFGVSSLRLSWTFAQV